MKHQVKAHYPVSSDVLIKAFTDKAFHLSKLEQLGVTEHEVLGHSFDGQNFSIKIRRKQPLGVPIPAALKKLIASGEVTIEHEDCWNLPSKTGHVNFDIHGVPVKLSCKLSLADDAQGSVYTYDWDVNARVPLIGKVLEKTLVADLDEKIAAETAAGIALLDNYS